jgi:hypothetical protein
MTPPPPREELIPRVKPDSPDPIDWSQCPLARAFPRAGKRAPWKVGMGRWKRSGV